MFSVIIPAYDESGRIVPTLERVRGYIDGLHQAYEVIVVDDGSSDGTAEVVEGVARGWPELTVLRLDANRGKGAAVRTGMLAAQGDLRLFTDADLSTPIDELPRLRARIGGACTVAIASRALDRTLIEHRQAWRREFMGRVYNRMVQAVLMRGLLDTQCGFKLFTAEAAVACFGPLRTMRFGFDAEVLLRARHLGWTVAEVPVRWRHVEASRVRTIRDSSRMILDLGLLRLRSRRL